MKLPQSIVSAEWLMAHMNAKDLIVLDASISKIGSSKKENQSELRIPKSRFFDLQGTFSDQNSSFPNTVPSPRQFQIGAQHLGIHKDSQIVIYDELGIYSSPRAWWLFKLMGFENVAVLDGGLMAWVNAGFPMKPYSIPNWKKGNFKSNLKAHLLTTLDSLQMQLNSENVKIIDARSRKRFEGLEPEPRTELRSGTIPNSINLPYSNVIESTSLLNALSLQSIFNNFVHQDDRMIFTCGSGVTACILALAAEIAGYNNFSVYDGSWTEYGSLIET